VSSSQLESLDNVPPEGSFRRHSILIAFSHESDAMVAVVRCLTEAGYAVRRADSRIDVVRQVLTIRPKVVLFDSTVPGANRAMEVCRRLKQDPRTTTIGVIILSGDEDDTISALGQGADDCIRYPFLPQELLLRIAAVIRRSTRVAGEVGTHLTIGALEIDGTQFLVRMHGKPVDLTRKEFDLLFALANTPGRVFRRSELLDLIWRSDGFVELTPRSVDVHIARLRRKFRAAKVPCPLIDTVRGVGYRFRDIEGQGGRRGARP